MYAIRSYYAQFMVPLGSALLSLQFLADMARRVAQLREPNALDEPTGGA